MPASLNSLAKLHNLRYHLVSRIGTPTYHYPSIDHQFSSFRNCFFYPSSQFKLDRRFGSLIIPRRCEPYGRQPVSSHSGKVKNLHAQSENEVLLQKALLCAEATQTKFRKPSPEIHQSLTGDLSLVLVVSVLAGALLLCSFELYGGGFVRGLVDSANLGTQDEDLVPYCEIGWPTMAGEILPGRPGNLTPEQEEKLREIWIAALRVFGGLDSHHALRVDSSSLPTPLTVSHQGSDLMTPEKPKKKRISLFGRKNKDIEDESVSPVDLTPPVRTNDPEDKYGQTKQFHETLAQQTPESLRAAFWSMAKHDHPDALLLRFLRARKWDVEKALIMMVATMSWRSTEVHVDDDIMRLGEEGSLLATQSSNLAAKKLGEGFLAQMRMGKSYLHGTDKSGRPMCFVRARLHKQGEQTEESLERYTVYVIESARMVLAPPVDTACVVFDMTGFSLANMDYGPVKFMIKCFEANYPESLGVILVHKAPWVFQGIWKIIRGWLDPIVASKVHFTNNVEEMEEFVSKNHIPKDLGGDEDWSYKYVEPVVNENEKMKDTKTRDQLLARREKLVKEYEKATLDWIDHPSGPEVAAIKESRHKLATDLKEDYWGLDGYVRARSLYDRIGMIQSQGRIEFYPSAPVTSLPHVANGVVTRADDVD